ncbi:hypothetical protein PN492_04090 [Dolichospermum circinale CS-537/01]|uniref:Uncharacterized protein n=2 Tax=Dolichospermum circinale TaxID=109265 RepID=A0ABT5A1E2_9CYAN|nr:hypothetical protein [Dolichospermum circinale]MDB9485733.1 hypothetical protein [Dolichospermum circinale CS-537/01]
MLQYINLQNFHHFDCATQVILAHIHETFLPGENLLYNKKIYFYNLERGYQDVGKEMESILPKIPSTNTLLITNTHKPDARNKSVKLLLEYAQVTEFPLIPQWQTQALIQQARTLVDEVGVTLTTDAYKVLIDYTGNHTRLIFTELEKLKTYALGKTVNGVMVKELVL